ncbi:hypothetical protein B0H14DRAFT_3494350 [Mycena olivaceomarginata]|nr:hypothetical protein B0H14DRAFT_3494350 [Mycena olivaceomarginata]
MSRERAIAWVAEAQRERRLTHAARLQALIEEWQSSGWRTNDISLLENELSWETARLVATTCLADYAPSRLERYFVLVSVGTSRLKYLHELHTPPFSRPVFPDELWGMNTTPIYIRIFQFFHELEHPPFSHPEFPEHPSFVLWRHSSDITGGNNQPWPWWIHHILLGVGTGS